MTTTPVKKRGRYSPERYQANKEAIQARAKARYDADPEPHRERMRRNYAADPEKHALRSKRARLKSKYGITLEDYQEMLAAQGGVCASCFQPEKTAPELPVDHNHVTGKVRALLCTSCNVTLGRMQENPVWLRALADYIEHHSA